MKLLEFLFFMHNSPFCIVKACINSFIMLLNGSKCGWSNLMKHICKKKIKIFIPIISKREVTSSYYFDTEFCEFVYI